MRIAFFEIQNEEIPVFKKALKGHKLIFFKEPINSDNALKARGCECISVFVYSKINNEVIEKLPELRYIVTRSMGFDHIDLNACKKQGIKVSNTPHYGDNSVAEHTFGLMLSLTRNIHKAYVRTLKDNHSIEGLEGFDLKGKTLGVIGVGRIGSKVVKIARGFEMNVIACSHNKDNSLAKELGFKYKDLDYLLKNSDIVTLHVPFVAENRHLINESALRKMKKGAILINTSRGSIVDTTALLKALRNEHLGGVGLDVIEGEDLIKNEKEMAHNHKRIDIKKMKQIALDHKILFNEKVVFTPHIAFYSKEAVQRIVETSIQNIISFSKGREINIISC
ncbi:MAG: NAD(P)-dependent oxidoreductase [Nanoarchaeota archaeon]